MGHAQPLIGTYNEKYLSFENGDGDEIKRSSIVLQMRSCRKGIYKGGLSCKKERNDISQGRGKLCSPTYVLRLNTA